MLTSQESLLWLKSLLLPPSLFMLMSLLLLVFRTFLTSLSLFVSLLGLTSHLSMLYPSFHASLLLASPVYVVISAVNLPGVPAVVSLLLLTSLPLPIFPPVLSYLLLLVSLAVSVDSCAAVRPTVDLFLPLCPNLKTQFSRKQVQNWVYKFGL
jgi:hypothetical protein